MKIENIKTKANSKYSINKITLPLLSTCCGILGDLGSLYEVSRLSYTVSFTIVVLTVQLSWLPELFPYGLALQGLHVEVVGTSRHDEECYYSHLAVIHLQPQE